MDRRQSKFLVHVRFGAKPPGLARIKADAPKVKDILDLLSNRDNQLAYTSHDGATFGYFVRSDLVPRQIYERLQSPVAPGGRAMTSPIGPEDVLLILEMGDRGIAMGAGRIINWFSAH